MLDLRPFCAGDRDVRQLLRRPFRRGRFIYATDGAVAVRIPDDGRVLDDAASLPIGGIGDVCQVGLERIGAMVEEKFKLRSGEYLCGCSIPDFPDAVREKCDDCEGTGRFPCLIAGGEIACSECDGGWVTSDRHVVRVGGVPFFSGVLRRVRVLPGLVFTVDVKHPQSGQWFLFDGGDGLAMPCRDEAPETYADRVALAMAEMGGQKA